MDALTFKTVKSAGCETRLFLRVGVLLLAITAGRSTVAQTPHVEGEVDWAIGEMKADPVLNLVYVVDDTWDRIIALNTETGKVDAAVMVADAVRGGHLDFSTDGSVLYLSTPRTGRLHAFETGTLEQHGEPLSLPASVGSFAIASDGCLYSAQPGVLGSGRMVKIDLDSGDLVDYHESPYWSGSFLFSRSPSGNQIFVMTLGTSGGSYSVREFEVVAQQMPSQVRTHFSNASNDTDLAFDEVNNVLYRSSGGVYGLGEWNIGAGAYRVFPYGSAWGSAVAQRSSSGVVYGASAGTSTGRVLKFDKATGTLLEEHPYTGTGSGFPSGEIMRRRMEVAPNGVLVYGKQANHPTRYFLGLIGHDSISPPDSPSAPPPPPPFHHQVATPWKVTHLLGDPIRNYVYLIDETNRLLLALNTDTGEVDAEVAIGESPTGGTLAMPSDGSSLYLTTPASSSLHRFLPLPDGGLSFVGKSSLPFAASRIAASTDGTVYAVHSRILNRLNPSTGAVIASVETSLSPSFPYLLRIDDASERLFAMQVGGSGGSSPVGEFDLSQPDQPIFVQGHLLTTANPRDLSMDIQRGKLFAASETLFGIEVWDLAHRYANLWEFDAPFGSAVAQLPSAAYVYGASGGSVIRKFEKDSGKVLQTYVHDDRTKGFFDGNVHQGCLAIAANGVVVYPKANGLGTLQCLGAIGLEALLPPRSGPMRVSALSASQGLHSDRIALEWEAAVGASGYEIYRSTFPVMPFNPIASTSGPAWADISVSGSSTYNYWVVAFNEYGKSGRSDPASGRLALPPPPAPASLTATKGVHADRVLLQWTASATASRYRVFRHTSSSSIHAAEVASGVEGLFWEDFTVPRGVAHHYWVKAEGESSDSTFSPSSMGYRKVETVVPTGLSASEGLYGNRVAVTWQPAAGATSYRILRAFQTGGFTFAGTVQASATSYNDVQAALGAVYRYQVVSVYWDGSESAPSEIVQGYRALGVPGGVSASQGTRQSEVLVRWSQVQGGSAYAILRGTSQDGSDAVPVGIATGTEFIDAEVPPGQTFYYFVRAQSGSIVGGIGGGAVGFGSVGPPFRPDVAVGARSGAMRGIGVFAPGAPQQVAQNSRRLRRADFRIWIRNGGEAPDLLQSRLTRGNRFFTVRLDSERGVNVSSAAFSGRLSDSLVGGAGARYVLIIQPTRRLVGKRGRLMAFFTASSTAAPSLYDQVRVQLNASP